MGTTCRGTLERVPIPTARPNRLLDAAQFPLLQIYLVCLLASETMAYAISDVVGVDTPRLPNRRRECGTSGLRVT